MFTNYLPKAAFRLFRDLLMSVIIPPRTGESSDSSPMKTNARMAANRTTIELYRSVDLAVYRYVTDTFCRTYAILSSFTLLELLILKHIYFFIFSTNNAFS